MENSTTAKVFNCPTCGASLEPVIGMVTMKCAYCANTIVIPEEMRTIRGYSPSANSSQSPASISDAIALAKQGKVEEAAQIYSRLTGVNIKDAAASVKSLAGIRDETHPPAVNASPYKSPPPTYQAAPPIQPVYTPAAESVQEERREKRRGRGGGCIGGVIRFIIIISIFSSALPALWRAVRDQLPRELPFFDGESILPTPFAQEVESFRPSAFKDPRAIGVDGNGNVLVFNYNSSDVQVFNPAGEEILQLAITDSSGASLFNDAMGVSQDGTIYIPGGDGIMVFTQEGERLPEIVDNNNLFIINDLIIGNDDKIYARSNAGIVRLNENGQVDLLITEEALTEAGRESPGFGAMGVDAQGNIYFSGSFNKDILKFSPTGEFIDSFSWEFNSVQEIDFDNYGRIYVVDFFDVKVFDANYTYIDKIDEAFWGIDFDAQNYLYGITNQGDRIKKYEIKEPQTQ